jgi:fucose 4-O-acetylase-like acetyltransferase
LAGHVTGPRPATARRSRDLVERLLIPYLVFNVLYAFLDQLLLGRAAAIDLTVPYWLTWFLLALFWWRLLLPVVLTFRWPVATSVAISLTAGALSGLGPAFAGSRTLALLPFFVLGATLNRDRLLWRGSHWPRLAGLTVLGAAFAMAWILNGDIEARPGWIYWDTGYAAQGLDLVSGPAVRLLMLTVGLSLTWAFLTVVPRGRTGYTALGAVTIYPYLLHGLVVRAYRALGLPEVVDSTLAVVVLVVFAVAVAAILSGAGARRRARLLVAPPVDWLFDQRSVRPGADRPTVEGWQTERPSPACRTEQPTTTP